MNMKKFKVLLLAYICMFSLFIAGCSSSDETADKDSDNKIEEVEDNNDKEKEELKDGEVDKEETKTTLGYTINNGVLTYLDKEYKIIEVEGRDRSGDRENNVAVDIGFGDREYWALTNDYGQLVYVLADEIVLQDDDKEPVNSSGRYYHDEANVPGTEEPNLDQGHVIADSLGGVANAYNITPQDSTLNRHGDQAYMEEIIRDAKGCLNFVAVITYPNTTTQIPSDYKFEYDLLGNHIVDAFPNANPEGENHGDKEPEVEEDKTTTGNQQVGNLASIDTNGNGKVTIAEAEAAGYAMPIHSDHWLYQYMHDADGDGMVGE